MSARHRPLNVVRELQRMRQAKGVNNAEYARLAALGNAVSDVLQTAIALDRVLQVLEQANALPPTLTKSSAYILADFRDALMRATKGD
jgi:hypothetical protein